MGPYRYQQYAFVLIAAKCMLTLGTSKENVSNYSASVMKLPGTPERSAILNPDMRTAMCYVGISSA